MDKLESNTIEETSNWCNPYNIVKFTLGAQPDSHDKYQENIPSCCQQWEG